jgi:hypothetical protein
MEMQTPTVEDKKPVADKVVDPPVGAAEVIVHDAAKAFVEVGTVVVSATETIVHDVVVASREFGRDVRRAVAPREAPLPVAASEAAPTP